MLHISKIDTSDADNFRFIFKEGDPYNTIQSLMGACSKYGDSSRIRKDPLTNQYWTNTYRKPMKNKGHSEIFGSAYGTFVSYEQDPTQSILFNDIISKNMPRVDELASKLVANPDRAEIQKIQEHYRQNQDCKSIKLQDNLSVNYDLTEHELFKVYYALTTIYFNGRTLDDYIDKAVEVQEFISNNWKKVFTQLDPEDSESYLDQLSTNKFFVNCTNKSLQSGKYGKITVETDEWNNSIGNMKKMNKTYSLFHGGFFSETEDEHLQPNNSSPNAVSQGMEVPFMNTGISLRGLVSLLQYNKSTFLTTMGHEMAHDISKSGFGTIRNISELWFGPAATSRIENSLNINELKQAFHITRNKFSAKNQSGKIKQIKPNNDKWAWSKQVFAESAADLMGIMLLKIYVDGISDPREKINAIIYSMLWSCNYNGVIADHPPSSISMNMPLIMKDLHDTLLSDLEYTKTMLGKWGPAGFTRTGGKRTRRARNKNRKTTRRRRM
jgi:hypothetical protein